MMTPDLNAYFARIGYSGVRESSHSVLSSLHKLHPSTIPFENLDPLLSRPVHIDLASIEAKLVRGRRGGYCYEHNNLFYRALTALGFIATPLAARVVLRWNEGDPRPALTHRLTLVELPEGAFIADVGFGGQSPTAPLKLEHGLEQSTLHGTYRILQSRETYELQWKSEGNWSGMYRFTLEPQDTTDFEMSNWFTSAFPSSRFRENLLVSKVDGISRLNLINTRFTIRHGESAEERTVTEPEGLARILNDRFGIDSPESIDAIWERIPKT